MSWVKEITDEDLSAGKIANLPDHPNRGASFGETGLTASQLKAYFDKNIELLQKTINNIIKEGNPATLAEKIDLGGNGFFNYLSNLVASIDDEGGDFSDKIWVNVDGYTDVLNGFLGLLQKTKVESVKGGDVKGAAYVVDENGDDKTLGYSSDAEPNTIVKRTEEGDILVPEGSTNDDAAISRKDAAALLSEAVTKDAFEAEKIRTNAFVKSAKVEYDEANHVIRLTFTDGNGETDTSSVDLPLEMAFVGARLEDGNLVFTLQNGQEVSVPIGDVLGGLVTSGALAQALSGNEEDKAPSARKITSIPTAWCVPWFDGKGKLQSNEPVEDLDCVNKKAMEDGLADKLDAKTQDGMWAYTTENGTQTVRLLVTSPSDGTIPLYGTGGVLYTNDPLKKNQTTKEKVCANVGYVDRKCQDLQQGVYNALGVQYITVEKTNEDFSPEIPPNAMRFACIESVGNAVACAEDGTEVASVGVRVFANGLLVDTTNSPVYVDMGESRMLSYDLSNALPDGAIYVKVTGRKIIYQVKVGG